MDTQEKKRLVVKIGTSTLTTPERAVDGEYLSELAAQVGQLASEGWQVVIVTSAAISCGLEALGIKLRPTDMPSLQAAASVGQCALSTAYASAFAEQDLITSLVLLTRRDTADRGAYLHARDTLNRLLELGVVPVVNENDTVSVEQIRFGDNDTLAALVACLINADLMVILSDIDGLYDANPREYAEAKLVPLVRSVDQKILDACGGVGSSVGSGGMVTKVAAARVLMTAGIPMVIAQGRRKNVVADVAHGQSVGTRFEGRSTPHEITPRKLWIALGDSARGSIIVDEGAHGALVKHGSSLLPVGVVRIKGQFDVGDIVDIADESGFIFARGKANATSDEIDLGKGLSSEQLRANRLLCGLADKPIIHRDDLVVFE